MKNCFQVEGISDEQANNEEWVNKRHLQDLRDCVTCCGCPMAQKNVIVC